MVQVIREEEFWSKLENGIIVWFHCGLVVTVSTSLRFNLMHRSEEAFVRPMLDFPIQCHRAFKAIVNTSHILKNNQRTAIFQFKFT